MTAALLCLACLFVLATQAYSSVRRRTSRRGKPRPRVVVDQDQLKVQMSRIASEIQREARTMRPVERGSYSGSAPAVPSRRTTTRAFTAPGTMPATSGSSRPISAGADNLALIQVPMSEEPCRDRAPSSERARTCVRCGRLHHNPCSARIDASSRKQFGMCDYPGRNEEGPAQ